jgi:hypothetical protein
MELSPQQSKLTTNRVSWAQISCVRSVISAHQNSNKNMLHFPAYKVPDLQNYFLHTNKQNFQFNTFKMFYQHYSFIFELHHSL